MIDQEFMERAKEMMSPFVEESKKNDSRRIWHFKNIEKSKEFKRNYEKSPKGKIVCQRRVETRRRREKELIATLTPEEFKEIKRFYMNRPAGCHVDHIIPISKGGLHVLSNLQYLSAEENRAKSDSLNWKVG